MTEKPTPKREGRPPSYSSDQMTQAIAIVEAKGLTPTAPLVKAVLVEDLSVSPGLNVQSLERELVRVLAEREEERERLAIAALPESVRVAVREQAQAVERGFLVAAARVHGDLRVNAERRVEEVMIEKRHLAARCEDLEAENVDVILALREQVARLTRKRDDLVRRLEESERARRLAETHDTTQAEVMTLFRRLIAEITAGGSAQDTGGRKDPATGAPEAAGPPLTQAS